MKVWIQKIQKLILKFSERHPKMYTAAYILGFIELLLVMAFLDLSVKAVTYPLLYEMEETGGIVMDKATEQMNVRVKNHKHKVYGYTYYVDGLEIAVNASHMRKYETGDLMPYYRYEGHGEVVGEVYKFTPLKGVLVAILNLFAVAHGVFFMVTEVNTEVLTKRKELENMQPPKKINYSAMGVNELYALCVERRIPKEQIKKRNAEYLSYCLRKKDEEDQRKFENAQKKLKEKKRILPKILILIACVAVMAEFAVVIRGFWGIVM